MLIAYLPLVVSIVGALVYALSSNGKVAMLGLIAYGAGLLVVLFTLARHLVHIG